ncbi:MAG: Ig-like domain-containing protein, partial [Gammaproteobacteria bacterium]|nr:Ig-like domain-containing protein [Gammaproteobacteria bacterium]
MRNLTIITTLIISFLTLSACTSSEPVLDVNSVNSASCNIDAANELLVTETSPSNGEQSVALGASITVSFNTCLDTKTIDASNIILTGTSATSQLSYDAANASLVLQVSEDFSFNTTYYVNVSSLLAGKNGELMNSAYFFSFTTRSAPESNPPTSAASHASGIYNTAIDLSLTCDDAGGSGCATIFYTDDGTEPTTSSSIYSTALNIGTSRTIKFFAIDNDGNSESVHTLDLTIDTVAPSINLLTPANNDTDVVLTSSIDVQFSEDLDPTSVDVANISIDNGVTATLSYNEVNYTLSLIPNERLLCNTLYTVNIASGFADLAGNTLASGSSHSFTTHTDCTEPTTTVDIPRNVFTSAQSISLSCNDAAGSGCARIIYTTDGTVPSASNGYKIETSSVSNINIPIGDTLLRFYAEDAAGNREVLREHQYSVSDSGFTFVATSNGLYRGVGKTPASFVVTGSEGKTLSYFKDNTNNRHYRLTDKGIYVSDDASYWVYLSNPAAKSIYAKGSYLLVTTYSGFFISSDGGSTFTEYTFPLYDQNTVRHIVGSGNTVYVATDGGLAISHDLGKTFEFRTMTDGLASDWLRYLALDGSTLYIATTAGLSISSDGGTSFSNKTTNDGLASNTINAIAIDGSNVYVATDLGLSVSVNSATSFDATRTTIDG